MWGNSLCKLRTQSTVRVQAPHLCWPIVGRRLVLSLCLFPAIVSSH